MSIKKASFEETLGKIVVEAGKCLGCGTCVLVCPFRCLEYRDEKPVMVGDCKACGICVQVCPQYEWSNPEIEKFVFGRERRMDEKFGVYRRLFIARASDPKVRSVSQDGGVVTALLLFALEKGVIEGAIVSGVSEDEPFKPVPKLATTPEEIIESAGSRYFYSPNLLALSEVQKQRKASIAFVGTPCQIRAVRKMQMLGLKKHTAPIKFLIGLMCSECLTYEGLMEKCIRNKLGVNPKDIVKMNIKGKLLITTKSGVKSVPLKEIKQFARKNCASCGDFSSEFADISAGGLGLEGWTFIILRREEGENLFKAAEENGFLEVRPVEEEKRALNLLIKLSAKKRRASGV